MKKFLTCRFSLGDRIKDRCGFRKKLGNDVFCHLRKGEGRDDGFDGFLEIFKHRTVKAQAR